ncbi:MAG TPA: ATP-binding protein [Bacteroidota bacterium]|nr:ATP-binding protein [Bacteroidota bacterium]
MSAQPELDHSSLNIVIAEDEESLLGSVYFTLRRKGFNVFRALTGNEALSIISEQHAAGKPIDLLITDIFMPGMNGEELIEAARIFEPNLPILAMTSFGKKDLLVRLIRLECDDFLDKPFTHEEIESHVLNVLTKSKEETNQQRKRDQLAQVGMKVRSVVHDLANMMNSTLGYASLALNDVDESHPARKRLSKLLASANLAAEILKNLMTLKSEPSSLLKVKTDLGASVERIGAVLRTVAPEYIRVKVLVPNQPLTLRVDYERIHQAILNLGFNAIDALDKGGVLTLTASTEMIPQERNPDVTHCFCISVRDNGTGISKENLAKIFTDGFTTKPNGHGFGLSVVKTIVEEHDGWVEVTSEEGRGTEFKVFLPSISKVYQLAPSGTD